MMTSYLKSFTVQVDGFFSESLLTLDVCQVVERISMSGTKSKSSVVAFFCLLHLTPLLQSICQVAVCIWKVWLQFNCPPICVNGKIDKPVLTGK